MYSICNGVIRLLVADFLSDGNGNVCSISYHLRDIHKNNKMQKVLTLKMNVKVNL